MSIKTTTWGLIVVLVCNQVLFDQLYRSIIMQAINSKMAQEDMDLRNNNIEFLRKLCRGQLSTYERGTYVRRR